jgi:hypothetical protein
MVQKGSISLPRENEVANLHCHTFFSYNAYGYSPSALAWLAKQQGYKFMGIVDFDVVDGVEEFLAACELIGVRACAGIESRVFIPEFSTREINSPGEPGVYYYMGIGFTSQGVPPEAAWIINRMRQRAETRNLDMLSRLKTHMALDIDYARDVLPLTPAGNATERHMLAAITHAAELQITDLHNYWADILGLTGEETREVIANKAHFHNQIRAKLMKAGGIGYIQPGSDTFPTVEEMNRLVIACNALPCAAWLDGLSTGEQAVEELLQILMEKGVVALNIIPDRNWNVPDPEERLKKVHNLYEVVRLAHSLDLPLIVGTEMNSPGQRWVDDFNALELEPLRQQFIDGAYFIYGHTILQRAANLGYLSPWAKSNLPSRRERNAFYTLLGQRVPPGQEGMAILKNIPLEMTPKGILEKFS